MHNAIIFIVLLLYTLLYCDIYLYCATIAPFITSNKEKIPDIVSRIVNKLVPPARDETRGI